MAKTQAATATETPITVKYNSGTPTIDKPQADVAKGGDIIFSCNDATLVIVCQYNRKGNSSEQHCPFATAGSVFIVPKGISVKNEVKGASALLDREYKYTIVVIPDKGSDVRFLDPTIIIRQSVE